MGDKWKHDTTELERFYLSMMWSIMTIARHYGVGYKAVRNALIREGIQLRKHSTKGLRVTSEETRGKIRESKVGEKNPNHRSRISMEKRLELVKHMNSVRPMKWSPAQREKTINTRIRLGLAVGDRNPMSNPKNVLKWARSNGLKPNKKELSLWEILKLIAPDMYNINVSGPVVVGNKIPDFVSVEHMAIVELFGDYWHKGEDPSEIVEYYLERGYASIVIWEHELKNSEEVLQKLKDFGDGVLRVESPSVTCNG